MANQTPSPQQSAICDWFIQALRSPRKQCLEVVARAGCGKTTLLMMLAEIADKAGAKTGLYAYNKTIATELESRIKAKGLTQAKGATLHATGLRAVSAWLRQQQSLSTAVNNKKVGEILRNMPEIWKLGSELKLMGGGRIVRRVLTDRLFSIRSMGRDSLEYLYQHALYRSNHYDPQEYIESIDYPGHLQELGQLSDKLLRMVRASTEEHGVIDYDDMLYEAASPRVSINRWLQSDVVLIDEAQDCSQVRVNLAKRLVTSFSNGPKILVYVGDPAQSIYSFAGALPDAMDEFGRTMRDSGYSFQSLPLSVTYRCPKTVVAVSKTYAPGFEAHPDNPQGTVESVKYQDMDWSNLTKSTAVLCRSVAPLLQLWLKEGVGAKRAWGLQVDLSEYIDQLREAYGLELGVGEVLTDLEKLISTELEKPEEEQNFTRLESLEELSGIVGAFHGSFPHDNLGEILEYMSQAGTGYSEVILMTAHKAKGKEWDHVYLLASNLLMPSPRATTKMEIQQELNLIYVAQTRAKQSLRYVVCRGPEIGLREREEMAV